MTQARPLAVVTGARRGIGAGIAVELASRGYDIALTDIDAGGAEETLAAIESHASRSRLFAFDLGDIDRHGAEDRWTINPAVHDGRFEEIAATERRRRDGVQEGIKQGAAA